MSSSNSAGAASSGDRYRILLEASRRLGATLSPNELYEAIYRETAAALSAPGFYLALHDQGRDLARVVFYAQQGEGQQSDIAYRGSDSEVLTTQKSSLVSDGLEGAPLLAIGAEASPTARSAVTAPLMHKGRVLGAMSAQSYEANAYDKADLELFEELARVAAVAIFNSQQFSELQRRRREAEQLEELGRALASKLDPDQVVRMIVSAVSDVLEVDGVAVWLCQPHDRAHCSVAESAGAIALPVGLEWALTDDLYERLIDRWEAVHLDNLATLSTMPERVAEHLTGGSAIGAPLILGGQVEGVLTAGSKQARRFGKEDIAVLQRIASQTSVALANARLHANLHALSLTDPLTGLPNRRRLQIHLDHEVAAASRGRPLAIAVFDIDKFKHYNDTFGHIAGDEILKAVGKVLHDENRTMNIVARYGGDEFVSVLSETDIEGAQLFVERVQGHIARNEILTKFGISISIGCAEFDPESMVSVNDVLRAADADMYEEKAQRHAEMQVVSQG